MILITFDDDFRWNVIISFFLFNHIPNTISRLDLIGINFVNLKLGNYTVAAQTNNTKS